MKSKKTGFSVFRKGILPIVGILAILLLAVALLWHGNANSIQAMPALVAQVYFDGEYSIADGPWQPVEEGVHIPATKGDVVLRGNFHILTPDGNYAGVYDGEIPIAFYTDHIHLSFYENGRQVGMLDAENPLYGEPVCGEVWTPFSFTGGEDPIEIHIHNPHSFGNETAIDEMLSNVAFWTGIDFEKGVLEKGDTQRDIGLLFVIVSLMLLGTALFSSLIHIKNTKLLWLLGLVILFAGAYLYYSSDGIAFWSESVVSNTMMLGSSMILYMFFLSVATAHLMKKAKQVGTVTVTVLGVADAVVLVLPIVTDLFFYNLWQHWAAAQCLACIVLLCCLIQEIVAEKGKSRWTYAGMLLPLLAFLMDAVMTGLGIWKGGIASTYVFVGLFIAAMFMVLRIMPNGINTLTKAKELETENVRLNAQLTQTRVATMMSQIRPHFIYNTLGSIEQLCEIDPPKAGELVHNFAKYLRGNFGELDNPRPIQMSQEMEHVQYYISIEKVRFPDMTFLFEMDSVDFRLPALTVQPIVENAVKHGLMKRDSGGTIRVVSYETDTHYCVLVEDDGVGFDTDLLLDDRAHMGIRNIRERLKAMVDGTLEIESTPGVGTKVRITIPKEVEK